MEKGIQFAVEFEKTKIGYKRECYGAIKYDGKIIGKYFLDFLVEDQIAVELKIRNEIYQ
ncbi:MAG: GxxExxY protein [Candidatus Berkelbacteria bacterium]|nr:GxxExxY protein [Candidatus Berkelbacteria bacterium]